MKVTIYCDGACSPNPGIGGWGAIITFAGVRTEVHGGEMQSTNNRMELTAAIKALDMLPGPEQVTLYTDSSYLCDAFKKGWLKNWQKSGWVTSQNKPVLNQDLWKELIRLDSMHKIEWTWVRGHSGNPDNDRCDELAVAARLKLKDGL